MSSIILAAAARFATPLLIVFSLAALWRGHNLPGGGFIGGLLAASAFGFYAFAFGIDAARKGFGLSPQTYMIAGLTTAAMAGSLPLLAGKPFLTGLWWFPQLPLIGELPLGTPLLFDIGVYLTVLGMAATLIESMAEG